MKNISPIVAKFCVSQTYCFALSHINKSPLTGSKKNSILVPTHIYKYPRL